jgi:two-component system response regulator
MASMKSEPDLILIVDDDAGDRLLMRRCLAKGGFGRNLVIVTNGEEALHYLRRQGSYSSLAGQDLPSLILLDLNMPKVDGMQVLREMQEDITLKAIPVVIFTTSDQANDIKDSYRHGAWYYLIKPSGAAAYDKMVVVLRDFWQHIVDI